MSSEAWKDDPRYEAEAKRLRDHLKRRNALRKVITAKYPEVAAYLAEFVEDGW